MTIDEMKQKVLKWTKKSYSEGLFTGTSGNLSAYDRENDLMVITPTSVPYETITAEDMVVMKTDGTVLEGHFAPSSEWQLHSAIYRGISRAGAVVHTHSPYATAFAAVRKPIPCALIETALFLGGDIPLASFAVPGTAAVGEEAVKVLSDRNGCLLANHGAVTLGSDLETAHRCAVYLEDSARITCLAYSIGTPIEVSQEDIDKMKNKQEV